MPDVAMVTDIPVRIQGAAQQLPQTAAHWDESVWNASSHTPAEVFELYDPPQEYILPAPGMLGCWRWFNGAARSANAHPTIGQIRGGWLYQSTDGAATWRPVRELLPGSPLPTSLSQGATMPSPSTLPQQAAKNADLVFLGLAAIVIFYLISKKNR